LNTETASVYVVDDDASFRKSLLRLLKAHGLAARAYESAPDFLKSGLAARTGCIVLDVRMPGLSGLDLQEETGQGGLPRCRWFSSPATATFRERPGNEKGAVDFLTKPVDEKKPAGGRPQCSVAKREASSSARGNRGGSGTGRNADGA
jgi:FixJ family two-component response regulator